MKFIWKCMLMFPNCAFSGILLLLSKLYKFHEWNSPFKWKEPYRERERYVCVHEIHCSVKYSNTLYVSLFDSFIESSLHFSHEKFSLFTFISSFSSFIWVKGLISKVVEYFFVGKFGPSKIVWDCIRLKDEFSQKISFFSFSKRKSLFSNE